MIHSELNAVWLSTMSQRVNTPWSAFSLAVYFSSDSKSVSKSGLRACWSNREYADLDAPSA